MTNTGIIASSPTKEGLAKLINKFFFSENWVITDDNTIFNTKLNRCSETHYVENKRNRWYFKMKL